MPDTTLSIVPVKTSLEQEAPLPSAGASSLSDFPPSVSVSSVLDRLLGLDKQDGKTQDSLSDLLAKGNVDFNQPGGGSLAYMAVILNKPNSAMQLIKNGAPVSYENKWGQNLLTVAVNTPGMEEVVGALYGRLNAYQQDRLEAKYSAMDYAKMKDSPSGSALFYAEAMAVKARRFSSTPAAARDRLPVTEEARKDPAFDPEAVNRAIDRFFEFPTRRGPDLLRRDYGVNFEDPASVELVSHAVKTGNDAAAYLLLQAGASSSRDGRPDHTLLEESCAKQGFQHAVHFLKFDRMLSSDRVSPETLKKYPANNAALQENGEFLDRSSEEDLPRRSFIKSALFSGFSTLERKDFYKMEAKERIEERAKRSVRVNTYNEKLKAADAAANQGRGRAR